ncbi:MAG: ankyrin repeat domain-containing protein [Syntrophomonadaceae bacterium]|jgi:ankyrin repeat protein|nr:ankyrin repeat domain-containing protein [Syntrophomonadaceae bacterium]
MIPQEIFYKASYPAVNKWPDVEALFEACKAGDIALVKEMVQGGKISLKDIEKYYERNPLNEACESGNLELVRYLIEDEKLDGNKEAYDTPLSCACESGNLELVKYLMEKVKIFTPAFKKPKDKYDTSASKYNSEVKRLFSAASERGSAELIEYLIKNLVFGEKIFIEELSYCLTRACWLKNYALAKYFIENKKVNLNKKDEYGESAIFRACICGSLDFIKYLTNDRKIKINIKDKYGRSPIWYACASGNIELINFLIKEKKLNIYEEDNDGYNLLFPACQSNNLGLVKYLVEEAGLEVKNPKISLPQWPRPSLLFACCGNTDIADYLIPKNPLLLNEDTVIDIFNKWRERGYNLLTHLIEKHKITFVNETNIEEFIFTACDKGDFEFVKYFIEKYNFDVNTRNNQKGWALLHYASCARGNNPLFKTNFSNYYYYDDNDDYFKIVRYLIEDKKADLNIQGNDISVLLNDCSERYRKYFLDYLDIKDQHGNKLPFTAYSEEDN